MLPPLPSDLTVAMAGLELLPATRLKVACSLLAADRLTVRLIEWGTAPATLLVADETSDAGRHAIQSARKTRLPAIRLIGAQNTSGTMHVLPRLATVREFVDALKFGLHDRPPIFAETNSDWEAPLPQPLLEHLRLDRRRDSRVLLEQGLFRVVSDTRGGKFHMLRRMPLDDLLERAPKPDWRVTEISDREWESVYRPDVTRTYAIETLWWRLLPYLSRDHLPRVTDTVRLRTWPDLDAGATPASWPLVLAYFSSRSWHADALAATSDVPEEDVQQVMALVRLSGLEASLSDPGASERTSTTRHAGTLLRMAKRFGLKLFGRAHG